MAGSLATLLDSIGIGDLLDIFARNDIDATLLPDLTEADLREMGLTLGQRKRALAALRLARQETPASPELQPERRQLTVLFCDLVGSTSLAAALDPEDLRDVIAAYHSACATVMRQHGGHIAYLQGDGLMVYFGYPFAREDDPERAIRAALDAVQTVATLRTPARAPLRVRLGVATGLVVVGDLADHGAAREEMVIGETPNLASRLQELAQPGQVVIPESTRRLAGALFEYDRLGAFALKGFPDPVTAYAVTGEGGAENRFEARATAGLSPIVGREPELKALHGTWREALAGVGRLALIGGEAGIGKSRLARAFAETVRAERGALLKWYCASHLSNRPLHPIAREIERSVGLARESAPDRRRARLAAALVAAPGLVADDLPLIADLLGVGESETQALDAAVRARRTQDALLRRVLALAEAGPLLLVVEDAHWADAATQDFIEALLLRLADLPAMVLVTHRPEFEPPWLVAGRGRAIALERLDPAAGARLIDMTVRGRVLPDAIMRSILEKADGVPLFVEELTKTMLEAVFDSGAADASLAALSIPTTLQDSLMARLDRLGAAKEVAQLGAVIGREFTAAMIRTIAPPRCDVTGGLARLLDAGLVFRGGHHGPEWFVFNHALVQDTAYGSLLRKRRREIHRTIAESALTGNAAFAGLENEVLARHCAIGGLAEAAAEHWLKAGADALGRGASSAAVTYLRNGLAQCARLPDGETRTRYELAIQQALAAASMSVFGWASAEVEEACAAAGALAEAIGDAQSHYGARWGGWSTQFIRGEQNAALEAARGIDSIAEAQGEAFLLTTADHAMGYTHYWRGEYAEALARADRAIARYDEAMERAIIGAFQLSSTVSAHMFRSGSLWCLGQVEAAYDAWHDGMALAETLGHRPTIGFMLGASGQAFAMWRDWPRLREVSERLARLAAEEDLLMWVTMAEMHRALAHGHLEDAEAGLAAFEAARAKFLATRSLIVDAMHQAAAATLMIRVGRPADAVKRLDATIPDAQARGERNYLSELHRVRGAARRLLGDARGADSDRAAAQRLAADQRAPMLQRLATRDLMVLPQRDTVPAGGHDARSPMTSTTG